MATVPRLSRTERVGWVLILVNGLYAFLSATVLALAPLSIFNQPNEVPAGTTWPAMIEEDPWLPEFVAQFLRLWGASWLGMAVFGLAIAWWPLRAGAAWAWAVLWYFPLHQAWQALDFLGGPYFGLVFHATMATLGVAGLALTAKRSLKARA